MKKPALAKWMATGIVLLVALALPAGLHKVLAQESAEDYFQQGFTALHDSPDEAIPLFNQAVQLDPNHANAYFFRGIAYSLKKDYRQAFRDLDKAIALWPDNPSYYQTRGKIYEESGDQRRAQEDFAKSRQITQSKGSAAR